MLALIHRSAWNWISRKFRCKILHNPALVPLESPVSDTRIAPAR
jgi:hypothetical protein